PRLLAGGAVELVKKPVERTFRDGIEAVAGAFTFTLFRRFLDVRNVHAHLAGQLSDNLGEALVLDLGAELEDVTALTAAKAVVALVVRPDVEAGRLLSVERTEAYVVAARTLERHMPSHDGDDVHTVLDGLNEVLWDLHRAALWIILPGRPCNGC